MKQLPLYKFTWAGFLALFFGALIPIIIAGIFLGFYGVVTKQDLQNQQWVLLLNNLLLWVGAIFAFDYFVCRPDTKMPLNFNFELKDFKTHLLIFPMIFGMMLIAEFFTSIIPTEGFFFGSMYEMFSEIMEKLGNDFGFTILLAVVLAPIFEEIVFRGIIQKGLINKGVNPIKAIWISALAFGLIHGNPWQFLGATLLGYVLGIVYHKTGSLLLSILLHCFNNAVATFMAFLFDVESFAEIFHISEYWVLMAGILVFFTFNYLFLKKYKTTE